MTGVLDGIARFFVAPAEAPAFVPPRPRATTAGVLAAERDLLIAAGAVAARLRREAGARSVLVCVWRGHDDPPLPAPAPGAPGASRLASKLTGRGLAARSCGVLCLVDLPADTDAAIAACREAVAAAGAPVVVALARRDPALDALLADADRLVLGTADDADPVLGELAFDGLARLGPPTERTVLPCGLLARQATRLGLASPAATLGSASPAASPATLQERLS